MRRLILSAYEIENVAVCVPVVMFDIKFIVFCVLFCGFEVVGMISDSCGCLRIDFRMRHQRFMNRTGSFREQIVDACPNLAMRKILLFFFLLIHFGHIILRQLL